MTSNGDLIVFVGPGVGHLTDLVLLGQKIFESFFARRGDIWLPTRTKKTETEHMFPASTLHACAVRFEKIRKSWRPMRTSLCTDVPPVLACFWSVESLKIMVKTYNCSCNRNMYLWWCSNVYKRLQSFIWRYFYCAFLRFCLGTDSNVQPGVGKFGCIWLEWFARGQGIWRHIFEKCQIPTPCPASPAGFTLTGA